MPTIKSVTRFPAQDKTNGSYKIPSVIYYDNSGKVCAVGAEATRDGIDIDAKELRWVKVEWYAPMLPSVRPQQLNMLPLGSNCICLTRKVFILFLQAKGRSMCLPTIFAIYTFAQANTYATLISEDTRSGNPSKAKSIMYCHIRTVGEEGNRAR